MFKFVSNRIWLVTVLFCILVSIYGYVADYYVVNDSWYFKLYNYHFVSIRIGHIGVITLFVALISSIALLFETFKIKNIAITIYKTLVSIVILAVSLWYIFDAGKRVFQTLPELKQELGYVFTNDALSTIYWMALFETFASILLMFCSYKILNKMLGNGRSKNITLLSNEKGLNVFRKISTGLGLAIAITSLTAFVIFVATGNYVVLVKPYKSMGPLVIGILYIICTIAYLAIIRFYKRPYGNAWNFKIQNHGTVVLILFSLSGMIGYALHETLILFNDNISSSGIINATTDIALKTGCYLIYAVFLMIIVSLILHIASIVIYTIEFSK